MSITAVGMGLALLCDILIAARLGAGGLADALFIALVLPRLIGTVGRDSAKFSLLTHFVHVRQQQGEQATTDLAARVMNLYLLVGLVMTCLGLWTAGPIMGWLSGDLSAADKALSVVLFRLCIPLSFFALGSCVLEVLLNSRRQFVIAALRNWAPPLGVISVIVVSWWAQQAVYWIAAGFTIGYGLFFFWLLAHAGLPWSLRRWPGRRELAELRGAIGLPLIGFCIRQGGRVIVRRITTFALSGGVTVYYFAFRLTMSLQSLVGYSVAITGQPKLAELYLAREMGQFRRVLGRRLRYALLFSLPVSIVAMVLHHPIAMVYGWGRFDADDVARTGDLLLYLGGGVVFYCLVPVLNSALYAQKRLIAVLYNMTLTAGSNVLLAWVLFKQMDLPGVALGTSLAGMIGAINLSLLLLLGTRTTSPPTTTDQDT